MPTPKGMLSTRDFETEIRAQLAILDAMLEDPGLSRLRARFPQHPAVLRRDALEAFFPLRSRPYEELLAVAAEVGTMVIDRIFWMPDPGSPEYWSFLPEASAERVRRNLRDPGKFDETLAEVRTWANLRERGFNAELIEEEGLPDIPINRSCPDESWVEVKFVHRRTNDTGVLRGIRNANGQIRQASGDGAGVLYLYLDRLLAPRQLFASRDEIEAAKLPSGEDPPPDDVGKRLALVERALSGQHYKSIAAAVVAWDDHVYLGNWPEHVTYIVRRGSRVRRHHAPRAPSAFSDESLQLGGWTAFRLGVQSRSAA